jgi:hypothetical protein
MKLQCQIFLVFQPITKLVIKNQRLLEIYPHAIVDDVSKQKMKAYMYIIIGWKLLSLLNCVKNVQYLIVLAKPYFVSKGDPF